MRERGKCKRSDIGRGGKSRYRWRDSKRGV